MWGAFLAGDTDVFIGCMAGYAFRPKGGKRNDKDEIIVMLAEQLAEVRYDRDLWKALYRNEIDKRLERKVSNGAVPFS